jgi:hypothetical protein
LMLFYFLPTFFVLRFATADTLQDSHIDSSNSPLSIFCRTKYSNRLSSHHQYFP